MIKNISHALGLGIVFWIIVFIVIALVNILPFLKEQVLVQWIITWIVVSAVSLYLSKVYFKKNPGTIKDGILIGIFWIALLSVLDMAITVPFFVKPSVSKFWNQNASYIDSAAFLFSEWKLWIGFLFIMVICVITAKTSTKKKSVLPPPVNVVNVQQ